MKESMNKIIVNAKKKKGSIELQKRLKRFFTDNGPYLSGDNIILGEYGLNVLNEPIKFCKKLLCPDCKQMNTGRAWCNVCDPGRFLKEKQTSGNPVMDK